MSIHDLMRERCSVRKFEDRPVEREAMKQVLEAARVAPSACNRPRHCRREGGMPRPCAGPHRFPAPVPAQ